MTKTLYVGPTAEDTWARAQIIAKMNHESLSEFVNRAVRIETVRWTKNQVESQESLLVF